MKILYRAIAAAFVLGTMAFAFYLSGSPAENRALRMDEARVSDIRALRSEVEAYHRKKKELPASVSELLTWCEGSSRRCYRLRDVTPEGYELNRVDATSVELCTTFERAAPAVPNRSRVPRDEVFSHEAGRQCFRYVIDTETSRIEPLLLAPKTDG